MNYSFDRLTQFRYSLRRRLPLVTSALIAVMLTAFLWVAFREVESALLQAGSHRAQSAADQLVNLLAGSAELRVRDLRRVAREPAIVAYLQDPTDTVAPFARLQLESIAAQGQPAIELWHADGRRLLAVGAGPTVATRPAPALPTSAAPSAAGVSAFQVSHGVLYWDAVAEVREANVAVEPKPGSSPLLGYVFSRRALLTGSSDAVTRLVGAGAVIKIGNQGGDLWSDLTKVVAAPPVDTSRTGVAQFRAAGQESRLGALALISNTPWAVWVEFPEAVVIAPPWVFLGRMSLFGVAFLLVTAVVVRMLSQRITKPLHELTTAAEAIAAGKAHRRVEIHRTDEIGRLGAAFNDMAAQIASVQRELEARVEQRTARLAQAEERTKAILRTANDAFLGIDTTGRIVDWNQQAETVFGWSSEQAIGRTVADTIIPERDREAHNHRFERYRRAGDNQGVRERLELVARRQNADEFPADVTLWASGAREDRTFYAFVRDITDRKRAEQAVTDAKSEADRANRAKSDFLSLMSHDLRTPLNAILGFAQLLELDHLEARQAENVQHILSGGRYLLELISEVLDITRVESGQLGVSPEPVLAQDAVQRAVDLVKPLAAQRNITITIHPLGLGDAVHADRHRLNQILLNLLSNAVKYNRLGGNVTVHGERTSPDRYRIAVTDTGAGIPESKVTMLFQPFERLGAEQTAVEGTGLGLALSRLLAVAMGGTLGVRSIVDKGSTFWVELAQAEHHADPVLLSSSKPTVSSLAPISGLILYIEDNQSNVRLMERILRQRPGVELLHAPDGQTGLVLIHERRPDIVLLDLHLPDMSGDDVLRHFWADPATRPIPIVVLTADATPGLERRLKAAGATGCLTKPINIREVIDLIDAMLSKRSAVGVD